MTQLQEFRFAGRLFDSYDMMALRLFPLGKLRQIYIQNLFFYDRWTRVEDAFTNRFREISISFDGFVAVEAGQVPLEVRQIPFDELARQLNWHSFGSSRNATDYSASSFAPACQPAIVTINRSTVNTFQPTRGCHYAQSTRAIGHSLSVYDLHGDQHVDLCLNLDGWTVPRQRTMAVAARALTAALFAVLRHMTVREGSCVLCAGDRTGQDNCIRRAVIRWFEPVPSVRPRPTIVKVHYCNQKQNQLNDEHVVTGNISPQPRQHPELPD